IPPGKKWSVTPNPVHGEVEFCNLWPNDVFTVNPWVAKKFQACYVQQRDRILKIPHHHLETPDKNNIRLEQGDKFFWLAEECNPVVEILSGEVVSAGVCAYMWDAHFGCRVTDGISPKILAGPQKIRAAFRLFGVDADSATAIIDRASKPDLTLIGNIPIYVNGFNTFGASLLDFPEKFHDLWEWKFEPGATTGKKAVEKVDRQTGFSDQNSLFIENFTDSTSAWIATAIGPAYGQPPISDRARLKLTAALKTEQVSGKADIAIRYFQPGKGSVFDLSDYQLIVSKNGLNATHPWSKFEVITPRLSPPPERVHLMLRLNGAGRAWFDDVGFEWIG
ncbi:MAG: hypothetical protein SCK70_03620, partial [bacterium]|nr:hypothetical protein [bacterium]